MLCCPPSLSHYSLDEDQRRDEKVAEHCGDDEVRVSHMWEERGGEKPVVWLVKFVWIRVLFNG